ncbi:MAG: NAD(P)/FAD-dependent oxidoreductase [Clostridia bacterium]|nr:NAD(P)/FAD-dependent oxidoreductase [Clostridia bacterium]
MNKTAVIGAGPAGMIAAATAANAGCETVLYERNEKTGKKLFLTGKGRCNITNSADMEDFFKAVLKNPKFLYSAFYSFSNTDIITLIEKNGVKVKEERGGRVFPLSDKSSDVIRALTKHVQNSGAKIKLSCRVKEIVKDDKGFIVKQENGDAEHFDCVIIATGGVSYKSTGSDGDGYEFARLLGHSVSEPKASLVPLVTRESWPRELMGLSLKNVGLSAYCGKKKLYSDMGEMMFTHFGVTGPLVLTLSGIIADKPEGTELFIDMKPALSHEQLSKRLQNDFIKHTRKQFKNALCDLLPSRMIDVAVSLSDIDPCKIVDDITREERESLCNLLKALPLTVTGTAPIDEAIITRGGINVREINPSTMESKLVSGLFFSGEVLDVDAQTGGYNLQIAYSTGYLAGMSAAEHNLEA